MVQQTTAQLYALRAKKNSLPDRWFHLTWPLQSGDRLEELLKSLTIVSLHPNVRYLLVTQHDETCTTKTLSNSTTKHPHYHAVVWLISPATPKAITKLFRLEEWLKHDTGRPYYYCEAKYSTSTMSGFINYVAKYTTIYESGSLPARVVAERLHPTEVPKTTDTERRMARAINWVRKGHDESYRSLDPVHYLSLIHI